MHVLLLINTRLYSYTKESILESIALTLISIYLIRDRKERESVSVHTSDPFISLRVVLIPCYELGGGG